MQTPFKGGDQESSWRPGSESLLLASGLSVALREVERQRIKQGRRLRKLQSWFEARLQSLGGEIVLEEIQRPQFSHNGGDFREI